MKTYTIEKATKVTLRGRINKTGEYVSLYLDWGSRKDRQTDWNFDRIYYKPTTEDQKNHNDIILRKAKEVLSQKNTELLKDNTQLRNNLSYLDLNTFIEVVKKEKNKDGSSKSPATVAVYECVKKVINKYRDFDKVKLRDIDKKMLREIREYLLNSKKLDKNSASIYFSKLGTILGVAVKLEYLESNPYTYVDKITTDDSEVNYIFHEDILKLKAAKCDDPILKKAALFASQTGMRSGDIKSLKWNRISKAGEFYRIQLTQEKTDKPYTVHFKQSVMDVIGEGEPGELVFPGFNNNNEANANLVLWFKEAGVVPRGYPDKRFTMHDFRHTYAITLGLNGANLYEISQLLGHRSIKTTERYYARILEQMKTKIVDKLPDL
jgi:integrase